jgi:hypothetical protein
MSRKEPYTQADEEITGEDVDDIVTTALEGGCNYWCDKATLLDNDYKGATYASEAVSKGGTLILHVNHDGEAWDGETPKPLTRENMESGIKRAAIHFGKSVRVFLENQDAIYADVAVQFAVFDKIIFG